MADLGRLLVRLGLDKSEFARELKNSERLSSQAAQTIRRTLGGALAGFSAGVVTRELFQAARDAQQIAGALRVATGSSQAAGREFAFVREQANRLGLDLTTTAKSYAQLAAAAQGTALAGKASRDIFVAISEASTALSLSADQTEGALRAVQQMISKGTVQSEELRGQLGERLPGAFQIAARAMGVTTAGLSELLKEGKVLADDFLPKFQRELTKTFSGPAADVAKGPLADLNRFRSELNLLAQDVANGGFVKGLVGGLNEARAVLADPVVRQGLVDLGAGIGQIASAAAGGLKHVNLIVGAMGTLSAISLAGFTASLLGMARALVLVSAAHPVLLAISVTAGVIAKLRFDEVQEDLALMGASAQEAETKLAALRAERDLLLARGKESGLRVDIDPSLVPGLSDIIENVGILEQRLASLRGGAAVAAEELRRATEEAPFLAQLGFGTNASAAPPPPPPPIIDEKALKLAADGARKLGDILQDVQDQIRAFEVEPLQLQFEQTLRDVDALHKAGSIGAAQHADAVRQLTAYYATLRDIADAKAFEDSFTDTLDETSRLSRQFAEESTRAARDAAEESARALQAPFIEASEGVQDAITDGIGGALDKLIPRTDGVVGDMIEAFKKAAAEIATLLIFKPILQGIAGGGTGGTGLLGSLFGGGGVVPGGLNATTGIANNASLDEVMAALRTGTAEGAEEGTRSGLSGLKDLLGGLGGGGIGNTGGGGFLGAGGLTGILGAVGGGFAGSQLGGGLLEKILGPDWKLAGQLVGGILGAGAAYGAAAGTAGGIGAFSGAAAGAGAALWPALAVLQIYAGAMGGISVKDYLTKGDDPTRGDSRWRVAARGFTEGEGMGGILGAITGLIVGATQFARPQRLGFGFETQPGNLPIGTGSGGPFGNIQQTFNTSGFGHQFDHMNPFLAGIERFDETIAKLLKPEEIPAVAARLQLNLGDQVAFSRPKHFEAEINALFQARFAEIATALEGEASGSSIRARGIGSPEELSGVIQGFFQERAVYHDSIRALLGEDIPIIQAAIDDLQRVHDEAAANTFGFDLSALTDALAIGKLKIATDHLGDLNRAILAFTDPLSAALAEHAIAQERRLANARIAETEGAIGAVVAAERLGALERARIIEQAGKPLQDLLASLTGSTASPLALGEVAANAEAAFDAVLAAVQGGDLSKIGDLTSTAQNAITVLQDAYGSTARFFESFHRIIAGLEGVLSQLPGYATGGSFTVGGAGGTDSQLVSMWLTPGERVTIQTSAQVAGNLYSLDAARASRNGLPGFASGGSFTVAQSTPGAGFFREEKDGTGLETLREQVRTRMLAERGVDQLVQLVSELLVEQGRETDAIRTLSTRLTEIESQRKKGAA